MCGITGFIETRAGRSQIDLVATAERMSVMLRHRGPDDAGTWADPAVGVALASRRLAILDLSPAGRQPMSSPSRRYVMVLNGEIYNHADLRDQLDASTASSWRGHSDTEVLAAGFDHWGVEETLRRAVGMFALAVWDREERRLLLARDRVGEKPLYFGWCDGVFLFGSELKALVEHPAFHADIDRTAVALFFQFNYVPAPMSIYNGIEKLAPGAIAMVDPQSRTVSARTYWSFADAVQRAVADPFSGSEAEAAGVLDQLLRRSVRRQMLADVPVGVLLSGGIDSSTVTALMQAESAGSVRSYTIGFHEKRYNEANSAGEVARHLGTEHAELYVTPAEALQVIPELTYFYDEPFADSSQIPAMLVSRLASRHVKVALSGDGGDEVFGGYNRHLWAEPLSAFLRRVPRPARHGMARLLTTLSPSRWDSFFAAFGPLLPRRAHHRLAGEKVHKLASVLQVDTARQFHARLSTQWRDSGALVLGGETSSRSGVEPLPGLPVAAELMFLDSVTYLPDDILVKVDRAAMAFSLETRAPFLDHHVVEFAWRLPIAMKVRERQGKRILRRVLERYVPVALFDRPKMGFGVPLDDWLRGPLRDWASDLLSPERLQREGYLQPTLVTHKWQQHLSGRRNWQSQLWAVLMFEDWLMRQGSRAGAASAISGGGTIGFM